ncbi:MAG: GDSL-type esterase/lipase family protein [Hyphomicrobiaceae bacterium]
MSALGVLAAIMVAFGCVLPSTSPAAAQGASLLTPFPENDTWRAMVIGDGFAEGLLDGLTDAFAAVPKLQLPRKRYSMRALGRTEFDQDLRDIEQAVTREKFHVAIVLLGWLDRSGMRAPNGRRLALDSDAWREQYGARIDRLVRTLRTRSVAVYWVGLPVMRRESWNEDVNALNELFRERSTANGARFIDIYSETVDENGEYTDRGPDVSGKVVRLRDSDGVDFTSAGYRKLAFFVERELKRDMTRARSERSIPLAGGEAEQRRINAANKGAASGGGKRTKANRRAGSPQARAAAAWNRGAPAIGAGGEVRADNSKVSFKAAKPGGKLETVTLEIVRPALAASVVALVTRRDKGDKPSQIGETVTDTLSNGMMLMRSVTATRERNQGAPSQQPFFLALTKGARLTPKPGRADDFRWPREDDLPAPPSMGSGTAGGGIASPVKLRPPPKGASRRRDDGR